MESFFEPEIKPNISKAINQEIHSHGNENTFEISVITSNKRKRSFEQVISTLSPDEKNFQVHVTKKERNGEEVLLWNELSPNLIQNNIFDDFEFFTENLNISTNEQTELSLQSELSPQIFEFIPFPIWDDVFSYFNCNIKTEKRCLANLRLVCKKFRTLIARFWVQKIKYSILRTLIGSNVFGFFLSCINSLELIDDTKENIPIPLSSFSHLKELKLPANIKDEDMINFSPCLTKLDLCGCYEITDLALANLPSSLTDLNLCRCRSISNEGLRYLLPSIKIFNISWNYNINNAGLKILPKSIQVLNLSFCINFTDEGIEYLGENLPNLTHLNIFGCNIKGTCFPSLHPSLKLEFSSIMTPFLACAFFGNFRGVQFFVESQCVDINETTSCGKNALYFAGFNKSKELADYLIQNRIQITEIEKQKYEIKK